MNSNMEAAVIHIRIDDEIENSKRRSVQFISRVLAGTAPPGNRVLDWLNLEEAGMRYVKVDRREKAGKRGK